MKTILQATQCLLCMKKRFAILLIVLIGWLVSFSLSGCHQPVTSQTETVNDSRTSPVATPPPEGMVLIPAGEFQMGSNNKVAKVVADHRDIVSTTDDEPPVRTVYVETFYMDETEVTNAEYQKFLIANPHWRDGYTAARHSDGYHFQQASLPSDGSFQQVRTRDYDWHLEDWIGDNYPKGKGNYPVTYVNWYEAMAYAKWAGKRLPTEAEWERAARGGLVGEKYPHGDTLTPQDANYGENVGDTTPVGSYPANAYGLYDMAGNVWEWCFDEYSAKFYSISPNNNPRYGRETVPDDENFRILRGGGWGGSGEDLRVSDRWYHLTTGSTIGFRCVKDIIE